MTDTPKPWDVDYVAPVPDTGAHARQLAKATLHASKKAKALKLRDPNRKATTPDPNSLRSQKIAKGTKENLSLKKRVFIDKFISEYIRDFSVSNAWLRAGGKVSGTTDAAYATIRTPYAQQRLQVLIDLMDEEQLVTDKEIVIGIKKEANSFGEGTSQTGRVAAWKLLAQLKGKLIKKTEVTAGAGTGGVMLIPIPASVQDWEAQTATEQEQLKKDVRT